jgi:hypothetical protein
LKGGKHHDNLSYRLSSWLRKCPAFSFCLLTTVLGDQEEKDKINQSNKVREEIFTLEKNKTKESKKE